MQIKPAVDKSVERVQTKLASMLNKLELEITEVEKRIGDKMVRLTCCFVRSTKTTEIGSWQQRVAGREIELRGIKLRGIELRGCCTGMDVIEQRC